MVLRFRRRDVDAMRYVYGTGDAADAYVSTKHVI